jgi:large subunit ribosomal protein L5
MGEANDEPKTMDFAVDTLRVITGQQPIITRAKKSVASFKVREGRPIGCKVTVRGERMWALLDRLMNVALPRIRDFRGVPPKLDGRGNYTIGLREQLIFPEIDFDSIDKARGMEITIVTTAQTDEEGRRLLKMLGMPFQGN